MFYTIILGHFVAAFFCCLGVVNVGYLLQVTTREMGGPAFFSQLSVAVWPVAVAMVTELLIQGLTQLEAMREEAADGHAAPASQSAASAEKKSPLRKEQPEKKPEEKEPGALKFFPMREPAPAATPAPAAEERKPEAAPADKPTADAEKKPEGQQETPSEKKEEKGLQFFKVS